MSQTSNIASGQARALRKRLLSRLAALLLVLAAALCCFVLEIPGLHDPQMRSLSAIVLLVTGLLLGYSMVTLVPGGHAPARQAQARATTGNISATSEQNETPLEEEPLRILYELVSNINTAHSLDGLLTRFLYTFKRATSAHGAAIWVERNHQPPELSASSGIDEELLLPGRVDVRRCLYERAATEGKIWVERDLHKCEKIAGRRFFEQEGIGLVSVPMRYRGRTAGVINLFLDTGMINRLESIKPLLASIAHHLCIAIERYHNDDENRVQLIKD
jgi:GAF domain-containing protein